MKPINNSDDVIDSRDVIRRLHELEDERESLVSVLEDAAPEDKEEADADIADWDEDNGDELKQLRDLNEDGEDTVSEWEYGATLVRESYWVEYIQELLEDIGDVPRKMPPYLVIDWEATADNLLPDYNQVDFNGVTYYVR